MNTLTTDLRSWTRTTLGIVIVLLVVQFVTGVLLAFYYVPSVDHAHQSVAFMEKVVASGGWLRSLHHYGSQWLALFAFLHVIQLFVNRGYETSRLQWTVAILLLALIMAAGTTGYSLPWDARAFFSTRIGEGLVGGLPFVGQLARLWLLGGSEISTLTLSRLFALHVLITPFLILAVIGWQFHKQRCANDSQEGGNAPAPPLELSRQSLSGGLIFLALSLWTIKHHAPLGPAVAAAPAEYLPRPGAQYLWLYQSLKYVPGGVGSLFAVLGPGLVIVLLLCLPRLRVGWRRITGGVVLGVTTLLIVSMTTLAYLADRHPATRSQLNTQEVAEQNFRVAPFEPGTIGTSPATARTIEAPRVYVAWCANCHGVHGEGATQGTSRFPALLGVASKPRRTKDDVAMLLFSPEVYGLKPPMISFKGKLTTAEMQEIAEWVATLK